MCLLNLTLTFVPVSAETSTPFASYVVLLMLILSEDASRVFSLALQNLTDIKKCKSRMATKAVGLELEHVVEETTAVSLAGWNLEKTDLVP